MDIIIWQLLFIKKQDGYFQIILHKNTVKKLGLNQKPNIVNTDALEKNIYYSQTKFVVNGIHLNPK